MELNEYLRLVADVVPTGLPDDEDGKCYISKYDSGYITRVGMEDEVKFLADNDITEELTMGVGFSPSQNKWYGWSHRAVAGFTTGSTCKKGDSHYRSSNAEDALEAAIEFWGGGGHSNVTAQVVRPGMIHVSWDYTGDVPNKKLQGVVSGVDVHIELGRGEWIAETMEDAKQMAMDFNEGVS